jgi:hypothetical protein
MDGNSWLSALRHRVGIGVHDLNAEVLLANQLVAISEQLITMEAFIVCMALSDFCRGESNSAR